MGAWGTGLFDNDTACDWAYELEQRKDLSLVESAFDKVLANGSNCVESPDAEEALAAAEVIARLRGSWGVRNSYTESVDAWVKRMSRSKPSQQLVNKALAAVDRVLAEPSEILQVWNDPSLLAQWRGNVTALRARIASDSPPLGDAIPDAGRPWWRFW